MSKWREIKDGRVHLIFEDPEQQAFYDAMFDLGAPESSTPFDVNNYDMMRNLCLVDPDKDDATKFPLRLTDADIRRIMETRRHVRDEQTGQLKEEWIATNDKDKNARKQMLDDLQRNNPEEYNRLVDEVKQNLAEVQLRHNIGTMMKRPFMIIDPASGKRPISFTFDKNKSNNFYTCKAQPVKNTAVLPEEPYKPVQPREPKQPNAWYKFWNNVSGGRWYQDKFETYEQNMTEYRRQAEQYRRDMSQYENSMNGYRSNLQKAMYADGVRRAAEKLWPEFKNIPVEENTKNDAAHRYAEKEREFDRYYKNSEVNIKSVFGAEPKAQYSNRASFPTVINSLDKNTNYEQPNGITEFQAAVLTHAALYQPSIVKQFVQISSAFSTMSDSTLSEESYIQNYAASAHMSDLQLGRNDNAVSLALFTEHPVEGKGTQINQARAEAKGAFEAWNKDHDPEPIGAIIAAGVKPFVMNVCRAQAGYTHDKLSSMLEADQLYQVMADHPEIKDAALKMGLENTELQALEANHQLLQQHSRAMEARKQLYTNKDLTSEQTKDMLAEAMLKEYMEAVLVKEHINADKAFPEVGDLVKQRMDKIEADRKAGLMTEDEKNLAISNAFNATVIDRQARVEDQPASERYRAFADPQRLAEMKEAIKHSDVVAELANMPAEQRANKLASLVNENKKNAEYNGMMRRAGEAIKASRAKAAIADKPQQPQRQRSYSMSEKAAHKEAPVKQ